MQQTTHNPNTLIVGAGLAGCSLAWQLRQDGRPFHLVGSSQRPSAANVAAGIINPVTGRWMTKSWRFDDFAPLAKKFYQQIEESFSVKLYQQLPAVRFCLNSEDAKRARRRSRNPRYANVLNSFNEADPENPIFKDTHGSFPIHGAAYVNLPLLITTLRSHFDSEGRYQDACFNHDDLLQTKSGWSYQDHEYEQVIFCEGAALNENPWFGDLPLTPAKGETLLCRSKELQLQEKLCHHDKWLLPYPDGSFRLGATYDEGDLSLKPTDAAKEQLSAAFDTMTKDSHTLEILDQPAGIRPSTKDARPFLGQHPTKEGLFIFNGLGSKGASLAPTLSRELIDYIFYDTPLDEETNIRRFS